MKTLRCIAGAPGGIPPRVPVREKARGFTPHPECPAHEGGEAGHSGGIPPRAHLREKARGFTMVEVLIVVALFSIIGVSLFQSFAMGLKVWKAASRPNFSYRKAVLGLERLSRELRQARPYPGAPMMGTTDAIAFASVIHDHAYNLTYMRDGDTLRREAYVIVPGPLGSVEKREVAVDVRDIRFSYYGFDIPSGGFVFFDNWDGNVSGYPLAVRLTLDLEDGTHLERTTYVPTSF